MKPGITVRPCRSITRVRGPACFRISELLPTAVILPSLMAIASRVENWASTVNILPFTRMVSAFWAHAGKAAASAANTSNALRMKFALGILISPALRTCLVEAFRCSVFLIPVHGFTARVHRHGAHFGEMIERLNACLAAHAAVLEASPRRRRVEPVMIIHPNHAEEKPARDTVSPRDVACPD